jgi:hypothetical protein
LQVTVLPLHTQVGAFGPVAVQAPIPVQLSPLASAARPFAMQRGAAPPAMSQAQAAPSHSQRTRIAAVP